MATSNSIAAPRKERTDAREQLFYGFSEVIGKVHDRCRSVRALALNGELAAREYDDQMTLGLLQAIHLLMQDVAEDIEWMRAEAEKQLPKPARAVITRD